MDDLTRQAVVLLEAEENNNDYPSDSIYTLTYKCRDDHDGTFCACTCHSNRTIDPQHRCQTPKTYLPFEIRNDENRNEIKYQGLIDTSPSSSSTEIDAHQLSTPEKIAKIRMAVLDYPLAARPCFEARRSRRVPRTALASIRIPSGVLDDFYLNLLDWGSTNLIALASASTVLLISPGDSTGVHISNRLGTTSANRRSDEMGAGVEDEMVDEPLLLSTGHPRESTPPVSRASLSHREAQSSVPSNDSDFTSVKWSPDGQELAIGTRHGIVEIWDTVTSHLKSSHSGHAHRVGALDWVPAGNALHSNLITSGSRDKSIITHDLRSPTPVEHRHDRHKQEVCGLRWRAAELHTPPVTPSNKARAQMSESAQDFHSIEDVLNWDLEQATSVPPFSTTDIRTRAAKAIDAALQSNTPNGSTATVMLRSGVPALASGGNDNKVYIWELGYTIPLVRLSVHTAAVKALSWAPVSKPLLATGGGTNDRTIRLWDVAKGRELGTCETESQVCNLFWSPATLELVSSHGYTLNQVNLWDIKERVSEGFKKPLLLKKLSTLTGHTARVLYMAGSPDGQRVATAAGEATVKIWDAFI